MKPRIAMLAGVAAAALASGAVIASPAAAAEPIPRAESYADLLEPVPDAMQRLQVHDELVGAPAAHIETVQYWRGDRYEHHHHHHHHHDRRWYRDRGYSWYNGGWYYGHRPSNRYYDYDHHHHHHHHEWDRGYR